jgi:hypothetical protein
MPHAHKPYVAYGTYYLTIFKKKGAEGQKIKNYLQKNGKKKKASYWCSRARTRKDREKFFLDFVILLFFFWGYLCSTLLEKQILFRSQLLLSDILRIRY